jgi:pilus assembly protein CpaC
MNKPLACLVGAAAVLAAAPASAQLTADQSLTPAIVVAKDKSAAFRLQYPVSQIVVAQPDTLQLVATTDQSFYVRGKALGVTNLLIYDKRHHLAQVVDVRVGYDIESLRADLAAALPDQEVTAQNFAGGILLTGNVRTLASAQRAEEIAERYAPKSVTSEIKVSTAEQVMVEVRVLEVNRTALKDIGFNLNAQSSGGNFSFTSGTGGLNGNQTPSGVLNIGGTIGGVSIDATVAALEQKGMVRTLAKPNLIAMSGQEASFLAGGEFPYPIPNGPQTVGIEFRQFGVKLNVTPQVEPNGQIQLKINPEVSALDPSNHLRIAGFDIPGLITRKAQTVVELKDGQSFAIAGMFQQDYVNSVGQIPGVGDIPIIGALFKSASWQRKETELVIIVTPKMTAPADSLAGVPNPLTAPHEPDEIDLILMGKTFDKPLTEPLDVKGEPRKAKGK